MMNRSSMMEIESRQKLVKLKFSRKLLKTEDKIPGHYLRGINKITEIATKESFHINPTRGPQVTLSEFAETLCVCSNK